MNYLFSIIPSLLLACLILTTSGCSQLGPVYRQPLTIAPISTPLTKNNQPIKVSVQGPIPGKPLCETVWHSGSGPYIDLVESKQIGWNQENNELVGAASWESTIYVPFGRIFEGVFATGLTNAFPNAVIFDDCQTNAVDSKPAPTARYLVKITVKEFSVSEKPVQHLNMLATVDCAVFDTGNANVPVFTYSAHAEAIKQPLGYIHWTAGPIMEKMAKISNDLAATLSLDIFEKLQKQVGQ